MGKSEPKEPMLHDTTGIGSANETITGKAPDVIYCIKEAYLFPHDMEDFLDHVTEKDGWVFNKQMWRKYGWRSRTTSELYELYKRDKNF